MKDRHIPIMVLMAVLLLLAATTATAQVARVFLAGTGSDAGDCTVQATPCRSLQGAVDACPVNGEIIILDNGGYGGASITKPLTVNASAGVTAFIARTVTVNILSTDKVVLRGLSMNGVIFGDPVGIGFTGGGTLVVENSVVAGFGTGISQSKSGSNLIVKNCEIRNGNIGVVCVVSSGTTTANSTIEDSRFEYNAIQGLLGDGAVNVNVRGSVFANNFEGVHASSQTSQSQIAIIVVDTCTIAHNTSVGIGAQGASGGTAVVRVTNSTIQHNASGMVLFGTGGSIQSYGNNRVTANGAAETFTGSVLPLS